MSIHVYADESWFPDHTIQTVGIVWWSKEACDELRCKINEISATYNAPDTKWSKIRAKKRLFLCAKELLLCGYERSQSTWGVWITVYTWWSVQELYKKFFDEMTTSWSTWFCFYPDKNLTLKRHTEKHIFTHDKRFLRIQPILMRDEPLLILADLLAGMYREYAERPEVFLQAKNPISYMPDFYKVALRRLWTDFT